MEGGGDYFSKSPNELNFSPVYFLPTKWRQARTPALTQSLFTNCESPEHFFSLCSHMDCKEQRD